MDSDPYLILTWHKMKVFATSHSTFLGFCFVLFWLSFLYPRSIYIRSKTFTKSCAGLARECTSLVRGPGFDLSAWEKNPVATFILMGICICVCVCVSYMTLFIYMYIYETYMHWFSHVFPWCSGIMPRS